MGNMSGRLDDITDAEMDDGGNGGAHSGNGDYSSPLHSTDRGGFPPPGSGSHVRPTSSSLGYVGGGSSPPGSPPHPHSPRMFVPQSPITPLHRVVDEPLPVFNQILASEQEEDNDASPQKLIPILLTWTLGGKNVYIEGSWDNWKSKKVVHKCGKDHCIMLQLASGVYRYRFIVDGERRFQPDRPCETDIIGTISNLVDVHDFIPESVDGVSELMAPLSPDSSYGLVAPDEKEFAKEPPTLPAQLHLGVLNSRGSSSEKEAGECAKPKHNVLDHVFIGKGWGSHPTVVAPLGITSRFQSKYVTTVLYRAVQK
ncbi:SNF1-related protein kinase regulatory subunit beta-1-like [Oryza brachyantha]|uniref:Association with the SNF1 complex (ASC) domain-containing protein n=1 Tax=Oryza brachyantha TaxID=4533 RepID=J3MPB0_ORYBR|nr:SNF1-related protein kinase regulatory subunit beta-1-like [Oryza brachyantha]